MSISHMFAEYIKNDSRDFIPQKEVISYITKISGYSKESVRGTACKTSYPGIYSVKMQEYTKYVPVKKSKYLPAGFMKYEANGVNKIEVMHQSYDCKNKKNIRNDIINMLDTYKSSEHPTIITFAGHEGLCVKQFIAKYPSSTIYNIEKNNEVVEAYYKLQLPTINIPKSFNMAYKELEHNIIDLINYDSHSYYCNMIDSDLSHKNKMSTTNVISLTMQNSKNFRNHGPWVNTMKYVFGNTDDPIKNGVINTLYNYRMVYEKVYKKSNTNNAREMRVFIFVKKDLL